MVGEINHVEMHQKFGNTGVLSSLTELLDVLFIYSF